MIAIARVADHVCTKAVVFDMDGTLVDTMRSMPRVYADTIRYLGGPDVSPGDVQAIWHIGPTSVVLEHFLGRPVSPGNMECFYAHLERAMAIVRPFDGIIEML